MRYLSPVLLILSLYVTFALEINAYWASQSFGLSEQINLITLLSYTFSFLAGLNWVNRLYLNKMALSYAALILVLMAIPSLIKSTSALSELPSYQIGGGSWNYFIYRYLLYASITLVGWSFKSFYRAEFLSARIKKFLDIFMLLILLWVSSVELIHILALSGIESTTKLGLSILWGISAVLAVGIGIKKSKKHLRVAAMSLFGVTLFKLFFYDISNLSSLSKTIVLVALGILMLIASFLYNRFVNLERVED